jgi:hypothetical protein
VAWGAAAIGVEGLRPVDVVVHDYALVTFDRESGERQHTVVVPRGTAVPSPSVWRARMVPTCASGTPEYNFKLVICEMGAAIRDERRFAWDGEGSLHRLEGEERLVVPLNESNPVLGRLDPPHRPSDPAPRLEVILGVDADRWLRATVRDLRAEKVLLDQAGVVRLV